MTAKPATNRQHNEHPLYQAFLLNLASIPVGRVCSYAVLAQLSGAGRAARLIARWLSQLPADTQLPWHRVINARGRIALDKNSDSGQEQYQRLLAEGIIITAGRIRLQEYGWPAPFYQPT